MNAKEFKELQSEKKKNRLHITRLEELEYKCDHRDPNGVTLAKQIPNTNDFKCEMCGRVIRVSDLPATGDGVAPHVDAILNVIDGIKLVDSQMSKETLEDLGSLSLYVSKLPQMYDNVIREDTSSQMFNNDSRNYDDGRNSRLADTFAQKAFGEGYRNPHLSRSSQGIGNTTNDNRGRRRG